MKLCDHAIVRSATFNDVPLMMQLEKQCPSAAHWTEQQYAELFRADEAATERLVVVVEAPLQSDSDLKDSDMAFLGFLVASRIVDEWELENIVTAAATRRQGLGRKLLDAFLDKVRETNAKTVFLEVRESNFAARSLYEKAGFALTGRRKAYYPSPPEDAVLYRLRLA